MALLVILAAVFVLEVALEVVEELLMLMLEDSLKTVNQMLTLLYLEIPLRLHNINQSTDQVGCNILMLRHWNHI
jgi:hypothetical protein